MLIFLNTILKCFREVVSFLSVERCIITLVCDIAGSVLTLES